MNAQVEDLEAALDMLRGASARWASGEDVEPAASILRRAALVHNHSRYVEHMPVYRALAEQRGLAGAATVEDISHELMFTTGVFKSYDPRWLEERDYGRMTEWLGTIFTGDPVVEGRISGIEEWRRALGARSVFVTCSSGTSGKLSFVPRDRATVEASGRNGWFYAHAVPAMDVARRDDFDCLVVGPRGTSTGIQAASLGVAGAAARSHFLVDRDTPGPVREGEYVAASEFLADSASAGRPVLVFATPPQLHRACAWIAANGRALDLPAGSIAVTGGGWKTATTVLDHEALCEHVERALGISADRVIDTYSTAEMSFFCLRCRAGRYHVPPFVEVVVLDDTLTPFAAGEGFGIIGFLDPFAFSYPGFLVTGDLGHVTFGNCSCGLSGWAVEGRIERAPEFGEKGCAGATEALTA